MTGRRDVFERIAAALERLSPSIEPPCDWNSAPAAIWNGESAIQLSSLDALPLSSLRGIDSQKAAVVQNLQRLAAGSAAHDMLLWGARGMGKSALIRAAVEDVQAAQPESLVLVQIAAQALFEISELLLDLSKQPRSFLLFVDDLGYSAGQEQEMLALRSLLDGGLIARPSNVRVAVTSNRRAIVSRDGSQADALHERDERDNALALADRFGLTLGFHPADREAYLEMVRAYTDPLDLAIDEEEALGWAIERGNRSGRTALQFATEVAGRAGMKLEAVIR